MIKYVQWDMLSPHFSKADSVSNPLMSHSKNEICSIPFVSRVREISPAFLTQENFSFYGHVLLLLYCLSAALSIALAQIFVVALILFWAARNLCFDDTPLQKAVSQQTMAGALSRFSTPLAAWLCTCAVASVVGINFLRSLPEVGKTVLFLLFPFAVFDLLCGKEQKIGETLGRIRMYILFLCIGFALSSFHTVVETTLGRSISPRIPGAVTESGQLALLIPLVVSMLIFLARDPRSTSTQNKRLILAPVLFAILIGIAWPLLPGAAAHLVRSGAFLALIALLVLSYFWIRESGKASKEAILRLSSNNNALLLGLFSAVLFAALVLNLKRGPWVAVFLVLLLLGALTSRRLLFLSVLSAGLIMTLAPARERMLSLVDHFMIHGGRSSMWQLGAEIAGRFPLGLGPDNAAHMRILDPTLPLLHRHMHNNLLNIAVETGWLGLATYIWWMAASMLIGLSVWRNARAHPEIRMLSLGLLMSLLAWQLSGLVEYNFGDGEVRLIAFFFMGLLISLAHLSSSAGELSDIPKN